MSKISIVVVDDHPLTRAGVAVCLSCEPDMVVLGQAGNAKNGIKLIHQYRADVVVLDVNLPDLNGILLTQKIIQANWPVKVVILSAYAEDDQVALALRSGAMGYVCKEAVGDELAMAVRNAAEGKYTISGQVFADIRAYDQWAASQKNNRSQGGTGELLSNRELKVLTHIAAGLSNSEISVEMSISPQTVKNYCSSLFTKIGVSDRTQAALYAINKGWVRPQTALK